MVFEYRVLQRNLPRFNKIFVYKISLFRFLFRVQFFLERGLKSKIKKKIQIKTINYSRKQFEQESSGITVVNWELSSSNLDARIDVRHDSFHSIYIYIYIHKWKYPICQSVNRINETKVHFSTVLKHGRSRYIPTICLALCPASDCLLRIKRRDWSDFLLSWNSNDLPRARSRILVSRPRCVVISRLIRIYVGKVCYRWQFTGE